MKTRTIIVTIATLLATLCGTAQATTAPAVDTLNVQGYILESSGTAPTTGSYHMAYAVLQGGTILWAGEYTTTVTSGVFSQTLSGTGTNLTSVSVPAAMQNNYSAVTLNPALLAGATSGEITIEVYAVDTIGGQNPTFTISSAAVPTAYVAGLAEGVVSGSITLADLASTSTAGTTYVGASNVGKLVALDSTGYVPSALINTSALTFATSGANTNITSLDPSGGSLTLGSTNTTSLVEGGTGLTTLNLGGSATSALTTTLGSTASTGTTTVQSGSGGVLINNNESAASSVSMGGVNSTFNSTVNIGVGTGTASGAPTVTIGSTAAATTGGATVTVGSATGAVATTGTYALNLGNNASSSSAVFNLNIGQATNNASSGTTTIGIGNGTSTGSTQTVTIGSASKAADSVTLAAGATTGILLNSATVGIGNNIASTVTIANGNFANTVTIGGGTSANTIGIGTGNAANTINIGGGTAGGTISIGNGGTTANTINIGSGNVANTIKIGNGTTASTVDIGIGSITGAVGISSIVKCTGSETMSAIAATTQTSYTVTSCSAGLSTTASSVVCTPPSAWTPGKAGWFSQVTAAGTITIYLTNQAAGAATNTATAQTWTCIVIQ